jgi:very-short-patch-repair endonuclease
VMAYLKSQTLAVSVWRLARAQHGVVALFQLFDLGYTLSAIKHRIANGRLHPIRSGIYAVGRPHLTRAGEWMAAVLSCGPDAALSHGSAAALWAIREEQEGCIHVTVPPCVDRRPARIVTHRRVLAVADVSRHRGIPVTTPVRTLLDIATRLPARALEVAVNEADKLDLVDPETLRTELEPRGGQHGVRPLRALLDRAAFVLTDSELERRFLPIARRAGLGTPQTQTRVNGFRVDFYWPELGLVVETDGLRYHRTASQQARDRLRDQAHTAAGLTQLRFTHWQIRHEPAHVRDTLRAVAHRTHPGGFGISGTP